MTPIHLWGKEIEKMKLYKTMGIVISLVLISAGAIWAGNVLDTDMEEPGKIVQARKTAMHAIKLNMDDANVKAKNKNLKSIQANAIAVDALARILPPLYKDAHKGAYDGTGVFYKGAPSMEIEKISNGLSDAAQIMLSGASGEDSKLIKDGIGKVYQTCGACHKKYRGKF